MLQRDPIQHTYSAVQNCMSSEEVEELVKLLDSVPHAAIAIETALYAGVIDPAWYVSCLYAAVVNYQQPFIDPEAARRLKVQMSGVGNCPWSDGLSPLEKAAKRLLPRFAFLFLEAVALWRAGMSLKNYGNGQVTLETIYLLPEGFRVVSRFTYTQPDKTRSDFPRLVLREPDFSAHPFPL